MNGLQCSHSCSRGSSPAHNPPTPNAELNGVAPSPQMSPVVGTVSLCPPAWFEGMELHTDTAKRRPPRGVAAEGSVARCHVMARVVSHRMPLQMRHLNWEAPDKY